MYTCTTRGYRKRVWGGGVKQYLSPVFKKKKGHFSTLSSTLPGSYFHTKFCLGDYIWCPKPCKIPGYWCFVFFLPKWQILIGYISKTSGHAWVTLSTWVFTSSFMNMHGPWLVHSLRVNINKDYYARGGALPFWRFHICRAIKTSIFSSTVIQWSHIFFFFNRWLLLKDPLFFLSVCHRKPVIFQFQQQIGYFKWFCAQSSFQKLEIQY